MNKEPSGKPPLALIAGPTASGKSALALSLAKATGGTIINADASQVYRDLRILTARPSPEDEACALHRLFGTIDAAEACTAARWAGDARQAIADAHAAGSLPILVGGTGLYIRTLLDGIAPIPPIEPDVRTTVRAMDVGAAHAALASLDPPGAARLAPGDSSRVARALEVVLSTGRPLAEWQADRAGGIEAAVDLKPLILVPDRLWLDRRITERTAAMIADGALEEVKRLLARALDPAFPAMRAIGVPELASVLAGGSSLGEAQATIALATRRYAKRQLTWFRHQPPQHWPRCLPQDCDGRDHLISNMVAQSWLDASARVT